jgi:alkylation response protein AidB-like acyl-CoA dehydrogenase
MFEQETSRYCMQRENSWHPDIEAEVNLNSLPARVRFFSGTERNSGEFVPQCISRIDVHNPTISRKLSAQGWLGLTGLKRVRGGERSSLVRFADLEELLAAGAQVAARWLAERQTGPSLLRFGTEEKRQSLLPWIAIGEHPFSINLSEPDSGSDLAPHPNCGYSAALQFVIKEERPFCRAISQI